MKTYVKSRPAKGKNDDNLITRVVSEHVAFSIAADGRGDRNGKRASSVVCSTFGRELETRLIEEGTANADTFIFDRLTEVNNDLLVPKGAETTAEIVIVDKANGIIDSYHIGDSSQILVYDNGELGYITPAPPDIPTPTSPPDQTLGMFEFKADENHRYHISRLMKHKTIKISDLQRKPAYILCATDGLTNALSHDEISRIVKAHKMGVDSPQDLLDALTHAASVPYDQIVGRAKRNDVDKKKWDQLRDEFKLDIKASGIEGTEGIEETEYADYDKMRTLFIRLAEDSLNPESPDHELGIRLRRRLSELEHFIDDTTLTLMDIEDRREGYVRGLEAQVATLTKEATANKRQIEIDDETIRTFSAKIAELDSAAHINTAIITQLEGLLQTEKGKYGAEHKSLEEIREKLVEAERKYKEDLEKHRLRIVNLVNAVEKSKPPTKPTKKVEESELEALYTRLAEGITGLSQSSTSFKDKIKDMLSGKTTLENKVNQLENDVDGLKKEKERLKKLETLYLTLVTEVEKIANVTFTYDPSSATQPKEYYQRQYGINGIKMYREALVRNIAESYSRLNTMIAGLKAAEQTINTTLAEKSTNVTNLEAELESERADHKKTKDDLTAITREYDDYKAGVEAAEAKRLAEAEAARKKAEEEKKKHDEITEKTKRFVDNINGPGTAEALESQLEQDVPIDNPQLSPPSAPPSDKPAGTTDPNTIMSIKPGELVSITDTRNSPKKTEEPSVTPPVTASIPKEDIKPILNCGYYKNEMDAYVRTLRENHKKLGKIADDNIERFVTASYLLHFSQFVKELSFRGEDADLEQRLNHLYESTGIINMPELTRRYRKEQRKKQFNYAMGYEIDETDKNVSVTYDATKLYPSLRACLDYNEKKGVALCKRDVYKDLIVGQINDTLSLFIELYSPKWSRKRLFYAACGIISLAGLAATIYFSNPIVDYLSEQYDKIVVDKTSPQSIVGTANSESASIQPGYETMKASDVSERGLIYGGKEDYDALQSVVITENDKKPAKVNDNGKSMQDDETKKKEETRIAEEEKKKDDEAKRKTEEARKAEEEKKDAEAKLAEENRRKAEEAKRIAEEKRKTEEARKAEAARKADLESKVKVHYENNEVIIPINVKRYGVSYIKKENVSDTDMYYKPLVENEGLEEAAKVNIILFANALQEKAYNISCEPSKCTAMHGNYPLEIGYDPDKRQVTLEGGITDAVGQYTIDFNGHEITLITSFNWKLTTSITGGNWTVACNSGACPLLLGETSTDENGNSVKKGGFISLYGNLLSITQNIDNTLDFRAKNNSIVDEKYDKHLQKLSEPILIILNIINAYQSASAKMK